MMETHSEREIRIDNHIDNCQVCLDTRKELERLIEIGSSDKIIAEYLEKNAWCEWIHNEFN